MSDQDFILVDEDDKEKDTENQTPVTGDEEKQEIAASGKKDREEERKMDMRRSVLSATGRRV